MACAPPTVPSSKETTNYARLCRLLVDAGTQALRDTFDAIHPPANLHTVLIANQATLKSLRNRKVLNATQWGKLFPVIPTSVSSAQFDIILLMVLLRNLCGLRTPAKGWDTLPPVTDVSREADITRVKYYRNTVYGHADCASVDDSTFNACWGDIRDSLVRLGGVKYKAAIDNLETECMDPEVENHHKELLIQWKKDEENVKDQLNELGSEIKNVAKRLDDLSSSLTPEKENGIGGKSMASEELLGSSTSCKGTYDDTEPVNHYCIKCKVCISDKIGHIRHTNHTKVSIQQATEEEKLKVVNAVEEMKLQIEELEMQIQEITKLFRISGEKIAAARNIVCSTVEELISFLKEHEKRMITELDVIEKGQQRDHSAQLEYLQALKQELENTLRNCEKTLQSKTDIEALQAQMNEIDKSKRVLKEKKDDIYRPCHVRYLCDESCIKNFLSAAPGKLIVSKTDPSKSSVKALKSGDDFYIAEAGRMKVYDIKTNDYNGDKCYQKVDEIKMKVCSPMRKELDVKVDDWHSSGTYLVKFTPECDGEHEVTVLLNDQPLLCSSWIVNVRPHRYTSSFNFPSQRKDSKFKEPCALAIDDMKMKIAVADRKNQSVQIFYSYNFQHLNELGEKGPAAIKLSDPTSVAFTNSGDLIVISSGTMFCFTTDGQFIGCINNKHLKAPFSLTIVSDGHMVVCDTGDKSVKVLSPDGTEMLQSFRAPDCNDSPWEAVRHQDRFFVSYPTARCVKAFDKDGRFLYDIGKENSSEGQLQKPRGLTIDTFNNLVVCDEEYKTLNVFQLDGTFLNTASCTKIDCPWSIAVSSATSLPFLIIADPRKRSVVFFQ